MLLVEIKGYTDIGQSMSRAVQTLSEIEKGAIKQALDRIIYEVFDRNRRIEDVMREVGVLSELERFMVAESKNLSKTIDDILESRKMRGRFEMTVIKIFAMPIAIIVALTGGLLYLRPIALEKIEDFKTFIKLDLGATLDDVKLPFYLDSSWFLYAVAALVTIILVGGIGGYLYYYKNDTKNIYKVVRMKAYDDLPIIFKMMSNLHESGMVFNDIMDKMAENIYPKGIRPMFHEMKEEVAKGGAMFTVLEKYYIPDDVLAMFKASEVSKSIWKTMPQFIVFSQGRSESLNKFWHKLLAQPVMWITLGAASAVGVSLLTMFLETAMMIVSIIQSMIRT